MTKEEQIKNATAKFEGICQIIPENIERNVTDDMEFADSETVTPIELMAFLSLIWGELDYGLEEEDPTYTPTEIDNWKDQIAQLMIS